MRWVIDEGPFGVLARHFSPSWSWPASALHVMQATARAALPDPRRARLLGMTASGARCIEEHAIMTGTAADTYLATHLRPIATTATQDLGEHEAIAWCLHDAPDAIFVTADKGAAYLGLAELGRGRVSTPYDLWHDLRHRGLLAPAEYTTICNVTARAAGRASPVPPRLPP